MDVKVIRNEGQPDQHETVYEAVDHYEVTRYPTVMEPERNELVMECLFATYPRGHAMAGQPVRDPIYISIPNDGEVIYITNSVTGRTKQKYTLDPVVATP